MGEVAGVSATSDGIRLNSTNTGFAGGSNAWPYTLWWKGELWYASETQPASFVLVVIGDSRDREDEDFYEKMLAMYSETMDRKHYSGRPK